MNSTEVKKQLARLANLISETKETQVYSHTTEIAKISRDIQAAKLKDEFFRKELTEEEKEQLNMALIIASVTK